MGTCQKTGQQQPQHLRCHVIRIWTSTDSNGSAMGPWLDHQGRLLERSNHPFRRALLEMDLNHQYIFVVKEGVKFKGTRDMVDEAITLNN